MAYRQIDLEFDGYWRESAISGLPEASGVYCVYTCIFNKEEKNVTLKKLIYIGESENVNNRVKNHEKWDEWESYLNSGEQLCFSYAEIDGYYRERAEAAMIFHHDPPVNTEYVDYFPFDRTRITTKGKTAFLSKDFTVDRND